MNAADASSFETFVSTNITHVEPCKIHLACFTRELIRELVIIPISRDKRLRSRRRKAVRLFGSAPLHSCPTLSNELAVYALRQVGEVFEQERLNAGCLGLVAQRSKVDAIPSTELLGVANALG
jgi:hypothetical protein